MAKYVIGKKLGMMQVFHPDTRAAKAVTVVDVGTLKVTNVRTKEKDGYSAVQIGYGTRRKITKPLAGTVKDLGLFAGLREIRMSEAEAAQYEKGASIGVEQFVEGEKVSASGITKGKGFAGVVKRHGFAGGPASHGQKHAEREPGSIGGGARAGGRVAKGLRMAGHMGDVKVTVRKLTIIEIDRDKNLLLVGGAIPGSNGSWVEIKA